MINSNASKIKTYVGTDGKIHFVDWTGADSVIPFNVSSSLVIPFFCPYVFSSHLYIDTINFTQLNIEKARSKSSSATTSIEIYGTNDITIIQTTANSETSNTGLVALKKQTFTSPSTLNNISVGISQYKYIKISVIGHQQSSVILENIVFS